MKLQIVIMLVVCALAFGYPRNKNNDAAVYADQREAAETVVRAQRQAGGGDHHDAVDFGAHTGDHGAFGWYADFPVHSH